MDDIKLGLAVSILFHGVILYVAATGVTFFDRDFPTPPRSVPVELVDIEQFREVEEQEPEPAPEPRPAPPRPRIAERTPADAVPLPDVEPEKKPDHDLVKRKQLVAQVTPPSKPRPPSNFDSSRIAALIDKSIEEETPEAEDREKILEDAVKNQ